MISTVFLVVVVLVTLYIIVYRIYPSQKNEDLADTMLPLSQKKNVMMPDRVLDDLLRSAGSTVMGFFYLRPGDRTLRYVTADQFVPLLYVDHNWYIEIAPSPKEKEEHGARLRIKTKNNGASREEIVPLPPIPKQKWVFLTVLREGRRFDVLYDNQMVASHRLSHYPEVISNPMTVGNKGLEGTVIHIKTNRRRLTPEEVEQERLTHVDSNGNVLEAKWNPFRPPTNFKDLLSPITAICLPGMPCNAVTRPPPQSLYRWKSPYA
jgi:hypothetical protein